MDHLRAPSPRSSLDDDTLHLVFDHLSLRPYLIQVSHVSRSWRAAAHRHRAYWQHVYLTELSESRVLGFECQLQASSNLIEELHIVVDSVVGSDIIAIALGSFSGRITTAIASNIHRVRRLFVDAKQAPDESFVQGVLDRIAQREGQLPLLESLYLRSSESAKECPILNGSSLPAPNLSSLSLESMMLLEYDRYPRLRCLALGANLSSTLPTLGLRPPAPPLLTPTKLQEVLPAFTHLQELICHMVGSDIDADERARHAFILAAPRLRSLETSWDLIAPIIDDPAIRNIPRLFVRSAALEAQRFVIPGPLSDNDDLAIVATMEKDFEVLNPETGFRRGSDRLGWLASNKIWDTLYRRVKTIRIIANRWIYWLPFPTSGVGHVYERLEKAVIEVTPGQALVTKHRPVIQAPQLQVLRLELVPPTDPAVEWAYEIAPDQLSAFTTAAFGVAVASRLQVELGPGVYFAEGDADLNLVGSGWCIGF